MRKIDMHHHLIGESGYTETLIKCMDALHIDMVALIGLGLGRRYDLSLAHKTALGSLAPYNDAILPVLKEYPDRFLGWGVVELGRDEPSKVDELHAQGFRGIKTTRPLHSYNYPGYDALYERVEALGMPFLFHSGIVLITPYDKDDDVCCDRMRPLTLDRVARRFPKMNIIIAHMGAPSFDEASMMARIHSNVYVDITGGHRGWRMALNTDINNWRRLLYWDGAWEKLVFGTDTHALEMEQSLKDQEALLEILEAPASSRERFFHKNAEILFGI